MVEWNESSRHLRVLRCETWNGVEALISATVAHIRTEARARGLIDVVDSAIMHACQDPAPSRRTVIAAALATSQPAAALKRI
jgi:hypothetical protein